MDNDSLQAVLEGETEAFSRENAGDTDSNWKMCRRYKGLCLSFFSVSLLQLIDMIYEHNRKRIDRYVHNGAEQQPADEFVKHPDHYRSSLIGQQSWNRETRHHVHESEQEWYTSANTLTVNSVSVFSLLSPIRIYRFKHFHKIIDSKGSISKGRKEIFYPLKGYTYSKITILRYCILAVKGVPLFSTLFNKRIVMNKALRYFSPSPPTSLYYNGKYRHDTRTVIITTQ